MQLESPAVFLIWNDILSINCQTKSDIKLLKNFFQFKIETY